MPLPSSGCSVHCDFIVRVGMVYDYDRDRSWQCQRFVCFPTLPVHVDVRSSSALRIPLNFRVLTPDCAACPCPRLPSNLRVRGPIRSPPPSRIRNPDPPCVSLEEQGAGSPPSRAASIVVSRHMKNDPRGLSRTARVVFSLLYHEPHAPPIPVRRSPPLSLSSADLRTSISHWLRWAEQIGSRTSSRHYVRSNVCVCAFHPELDGGDSSWTRSIDALGVSSRPIAVVPSSRMHTSPTSLNRDLWPTNINTAIPRQRRIPPSKASTTEAQERLPEPFRYLLALRCGLYLTRLADRRISK
ncbi:hypothetical protein HYDPIDRAFT_119364 [Hydnomerulius pinastri MD-312]|uniref:Unplaced genomic scaffold scaffold_87, whole genome shotgun sequence n=1 Tax=Hydnomerulius pinastri MD-312 TaxID=994086 RepID=A0A0C9VLY0_9AGAM|nr:hypothetical protein HYDPIDRAFT_119364 [Hydnomerulius pinastri MD-312]